MRRPSCLLSLVMPFSFACTSSCRYTALAQSLYGQVLYTFPWPLTSFLT